MIAVRIARNVGLYLLFGLITVLAGDAWLLFINLGAWISGGQVDGVGSVFAWGTCGGIGAYAGVALLNRFFRPYPARVFGAVFAVLATCLVAASVAAVGADSRFPRLEEWQFIVRTMVSAATVWIMLWVGRGSLPFLVAEPDTQ